MPVTPQLLDEYEKLIVNYRSQSNFRVLPRFREDTNFSKNLSRLDGLMTAVRDQRERLNDSTIIHALMTYVFDKTTSDPTLFSCVQQFKKSYEASIKNVCSILDPMHLEPIPGTDQVNIPELLLITIHIQKVNHESERRAFERQLETSQRDNGQLRSTVEALKKKEIELEQLKIKFQQLQEVNAQLHQAGIAFSGLDRILDPLQSSDAPPALPVETVATQASTTEAAPPPPPPPLPPPLASAVSEPSADMQASMNESPRPAPTKKANENAVRFRPDVTAPPGRGDLLAQLKNRLAAMNTTEEQTGASRLQQNQSAVSSLPQVLSRPTPKPRPLTKNAPTSAQNDTLQATGSSESPQGLVHESAGQPPRQKQPEIPVGQHSSASFFQPVTTLSPTRLSPSVEPIGSLQSLSQPNAAVSSDSPRLDRERVTVIDTTEQKPKRAPNSFELYQESLRRTKPDGNLITTISELIKKRRGRIGSSESSSEDETWGDDASNDNATAAVAKEEDVWETISLA